MMSRLSTAVLLRLLGMYQALRPILGPGGCRFSPSCSEFAKEAINTHGALRGMSLTLGRIARCHPFHPGGVDPCPAEPR